MSIAHQKVRPAVDAAEVERRIGFARAGSALAGHEVTDTVARDLVRRVAAEELTGDEAVALLKDHVLNAR